MDNKTTHDLKAGVSAPVAGTVSTINDVARLAGVSIKTVSRVMNNEPNVRSETRLKVQEAANLLHYRPNLLARSLAGARSFLIGLFYDNPNPSYINAVQNGVIRRCRETGFHMLSEPQDSHSENLEREISGLLATIRLDGVILTPPLCDMPVVLHAIEMAAVPYVRISPFLNPGRSPIVRMDETRAAYEMTQHLIEMGHRDIGFVMGHPEHGGAHLRFEGFTKALNEAGITPRPDWVKQGYFSYESGIEAGKAFFTEGKPRPTAIFSSNDYMAFGIMGVAQQMGIRIPEDISICGFDDAPGSILIWPHVTTIRQPVEDLAYTAADILLARTNATDEAHAKRYINRMLPFELIMRNSVGKL